MGSTALLQASGTSTTCGIYSADAINLNNIVQNAASINSKITAGNAMDSVFGGLVRDNPAGGTLAFTKAGASKLTLGNAGTFTGGVASVGGTLISSANNGLGTGGMTIGDGSGNNAGAGQLNSVTLGTGLTALNVGTGGRDFGQLAYAAGNGTLKVRAADGVGRAALNIGTGTATTGVLGGTGVINNVDLSGHSADLLLAAVAIGTQSRSGLHTNSLTFDTGTRDMTSLTAGV